MSNTTVNPFGLRESLATLFRHKRLIVGIALLSALTSFAVAMLQSKVWESAARLVVQQNRQAVRVGAGVNGQDIPLVHSRAEQVRTEIEIMSSPVVLAEVAQRLGPATVLEKMRWRWDWLRELPDRVIDPVRQWVMGSLFGRGPGDGTSELQLAVRKISAHLAIEPVRESAVFIVAAEGPDPAFATRLVDTVLEVYLQHHLAVRQVAVSSGVFATESQRLRAELEEAVERQRSLKARAGVIELGPEKQLLLQRLSEAEAALVKANMEASESARRIAEAERQLTRRSPEVDLQNTSSRNPALDGLRQQLSQLEIERGNYQADSAPARALAIEIESVQARLRNEQERVSSSRVSGPDTTYREVERGLLSDRTRLSALAARGDLRRQIEQHRAELRQLDALEAEMKAADREVELKEEALRASLRKQQEERLGGLLNESRIADVVPIERASVPDRPSRPRVAVVSLVGLGAGLLGGLALAFLIEYFRRTFTTREEVSEQLGVPVLASLLDSHWERAAPAVNQIELRHVAEALRLERQRLEPARGLSVLITSTSPGEGKSALVIGLSALLERSDGGCRVVDASKGTLHLPGLDAPINLEHADDAAVQKARQALQALCARYDTVLVDGPAVGRSGQGLWLPDVVDRVVLVVQAEYTTGMNAAHTLKVIDAAGGRLLGTVLNRRRLVIPAWVYGWLLSPRQAMSS